MSRVGIWLSLIVGWLPIGALFALLMLSAHGGLVSDAVLIALRMLVAAALLGLLVHRLIARLPWPHPFQLRFIGIHLLAACVYSVSWLLLNSLIESAIRGQLGVVVGPGLGAYLVLGVWLYVMVAGVAYAIRAAERSAQLETLAARTQLAALRAQLHPHFLFNALHTVMQLIPSDPRAAAHAAEQLAGVLRTAFDEQRDLIPLADEWAFVQRYLAIECLRFGDRLVLCSDIDPAANTYLLPAFALQTLVENAVRHGAAPRVEATTISICAQVDERALVLTVADTGAGASDAQIAHSHGTGLRRLRERLAWLYGTRAQLVLASADAGGLTATLILPQSAAGAHDDD